MTTAERVFPGRSGQLGRLYAFGYDAFRLVNELPRMRSGSLGPLPGVTGRLAVDAQRPRATRTRLGADRERRAVPWPTPPLPRQRREHRAAPRTRPRGRGGRGAAPRARSAIGSSPRTFRAKGGELDLVAMDGTALAIVEVRYRASDRFGGAAASITPGKRGRIIRAARALLATNPPLAKLPARFDVVEVSGAVDRLDCQLIRGAFSL